MQHHFKTLALLICISLILSACAQKHASTASNKSDSTQTQAKKDSVTIVADAEKDASEETISNDSRPVAVMIDNDNDDARPQAGLDNAYLIYEVIIEGGATRFMALYNTPEVEKIGPVRSSRHYFLDYVKENDAIYVHFGWSPKAQTDIPALNVNNINGIIGGDDKIFWRDRTHTSDWHSAYTSMDKILDMATQKKYSNKTERTSPFAYSEKDITPSSDSAGVDISLRYSNLYRTGYIYDEKTQLYTKTINSEPHTMQNGNVLTFKNIIIQLIPDTALGDGTARRDVKTVNSGNGYFITNGKCEKITWSKSARTENTVYKKEDGTPLVINSGKTIVNLINPSSGITVN